MNFFSFSFYHSSINYLFNFFRSYFSSNFLYIFSNCFYFRVYNSSINYLFISSIFDININNYFLSVFSVKYFLLFSLANFFMCAVLFYFSLISILIFYPTIFVAHNCDNWGFFSLFLGDLLINYDLYV